MQIFDANVTGLDDSGRDRFWSLLKREVDAASRAPVSMYALRIKLVANCAELAYNRAIKLIDQNQ